jgi:molybdopterin-containing oxidoreductase family membrane subunit
MASTQLAGPLPTPQRNPYYLFWIGSLLIFLAIGLVGIVRTLLYGLEVTGLNNQVPWGLWITQDLSSIGLGAGAFTFSAIVYLFRVKRFEPLARAAVFVGFLGYTSAMLVLAMDIGRPDRFWHPLVYWNVHSVLWEITWCVILYSIVLALEFLPILLSTPWVKSRWPNAERIGHAVHRLSPVFAVMGLALSLLHQSSLGATYGVLSGRAIWFKPSMPVMFIISAVAGGISLTLFATILTGRLTSRRLIPWKLEREVARIAGFTLAAYLYFKLWDWAATSYYSSSPGTASALARLQATTPYTQTFWFLEIILGGIVPAVILLSRLRRNENALLFALPMVVMGVVVNRWNVTLSGLVVPPDWSPGVLGNLVAVSYTPTFTEVAVAVGVLAYGLLAFTLGARYLPLYAPEPADGVH